MALRGYQVTFNGQPKGQVFQHSRRWVWERPNGKGMERYSRNTRLLGVRAHIARLCGGKIPDVHFTPGEIT